MLSSRVTVAFKNIEIMDGVNFWEMFTSGA